MSYQRIVLSKVLKHILPCGILLFYAFSNIYAVNPYYTKTFSQYSTYMKAKKYPEAKQELTKILSDYKDKSEIQVYGHLFLGGLEEKLKNHEASISAYQYVVDHAVELNNEHTRTVSVEAIYWMGISYSNLGQYGNATVQYMKVIENYPEHRKSQSALGGLVHSYRLLKKEQEIESLLMKISQKYSEYPTKYYALRQLGLYYANNRQYNKALSVYNQILNELSIEKYPALTEMKENEIPTRIRVVQEKMSKESENQ